MQVGLRNRLHRNSVDAGRRRGAGSAFRLVYDGVAVPPALCRACPGSSSQARLEIQLALRAKPIVLMPKDEAFRCGIMGAALLLAAPNSGRGRHRPSRIRRRQDWLRLSSIWASMLASVCPALISINAGALEICIEGCRACAPNDQLSHGVLTE